MRVFKVSLKMDEVKLIKKRYENIAKLRSIIIIYGVRDKTSIVE